MRPDLELVHIRKGESFAAWRHGYPFRTVRWHYHPEYEIHLVVETSGQFFLGDHAGTFAPGQLTLIGPDLPHNWISEVAPGQNIGTRSLVIQIPATVLDTAVSRFREMESLATLLAASRRGCLFDAQTSDLVRPLMLDLIEAEGIARLTILWEILAVLAAAPTPEVIASLSYSLDPVANREGGINRALAYLRDTITEDVSEADLARIVGQSPTAFSRAFKRHTGESLVRYRNRLRIDLACQMLLTQPDLLVSEICYECGFRNLSNFNRQFLNAKGISPTAFRATFAVNDAFTGTGPSRETDPDIAPPVLRRVAGQRE